MEVQVPSRPQVGSAGPQHDAVVHARVGGARLRVAAEHCRRRDPRKSLPTVGGERDGELAQSTVLQQAIADVNLFLDRPAFDQRRRDVRLESMCPALPRLIEPGGLHDRPGAIGEQ